MFGASKKAKACAITEDVARARAENENAIRHLLDTIAEAVSGEKPTSLIEERQRRRAARQLPN